MAHSLQPIQPDSQQRPKRLRVVALGALAAAVSAGLLYQYGPAAGWLPECLFHRWTGLLCPSCGMTRGVHAALHGRFLDALRFNPLGMVMLPVAVMGLGLVIAGWLRGQGLPARRWRPGVRGAWLLGSVVLGYWILRNISGWPFSLLAPP